MGDIVDMNKQLKRVNSLAEQAKRDEPYLNKFIRTKIGVE